MVDWPTTTGSKRMPPRSSGSPIRLPCDASLPVRLAKKRLEARPALDRAKPFSLALRLSPRSSSRPCLTNGALGRSNVDCLTGGRSAWAGTLQAPTINGEASLLDARFLPPPPWPEVNKSRAQVRFLDTEALIDSLHCEVDSTPIQLRGRLTTSPPTFGLTLTPEKGVIELASLLDNTADLSSIRLLGEGRSDRQPHLQLAFARGTVWPPFVSSLTITTEEPGHSSSFQTTYFFRPRAVDAESAASCGAFRPRRKLDLSWKKLNENWRRALTRSP